MPKFTDSFIGRVRDAADIASIIGEHVQLKKEGSNLVGLCPFHTEKTPSFNVVPGKKIFKCFGCEAKGDVFKFITLIKNVKFGEAVKSVAERLNIPLEYEPPKPKSKISASAGAAVGSHPEPSGPADAVVEEEGEVEGEELPPESSASSIAIQCLREFYEKIVLSEKDLQTHWQKRGLRAGFLKSYGIKSGLRSNVDIINELAKKYPVQALIDCGLYVQRKGEGARPSPKFYGWGIVSKKAKSERRDKDDKWNYGWCEPPLIPYLGDDNLLYALRPHKDQVAGATSRFYVPRQVPESAPPSSDGSENVQRAAFEADTEKTFHQAVITEGELKSLAALQSVGDPALGDAAWAMGAIPGITNAKPMFSDIVDWLDEIGARQVVIVYDDEEKGDPKLPGYIEHEWERYDAQIWARYLAQQLAKEGFQASVGNFPREWRDEKGKTDWDGALVHLIRKFTNTAKDQPLPEESAVAPEVWKKIRAEFLKVLKDARPVELLRQFGLFDKEAERHIQSGLNRISKEPQLPVGSRNEESIARRIQRFLRKHRDDLTLCPIDRRAALSSLAKKYLTLNGRYYILKELTEKTAPKWERELKKADDDNNVEYKRVIEIAKKGIPQWVSDFYIKAHYCLKKANGTRDRLVTIHNVHGVSTSLLSLPSAAFSQPSKFREWLLDNISGATWRAGERELNDLQADIAKDVSWLDVQEVVLRGYHEESGIWFFEDVMFVKDGSEVLPDKKTGIFWHEGPGWRQGYKLSKFGNAKQPFRMGFPKMRPDRPDPNLPDLFYELAGKFWESVGWSAEDKSGFDGFICLGIAFSCFAGPEIYDRYVGMVGLWLHGESQQGKNCSSRWLLPIHGFDRQKTGIVLPGSTEAGLGHALEQYSNLFVWLEEYQPEMARTKPWLVEKIKNTFDRGSGTKMVFGDELRQIRAVALVNGIATASDPQVKNRYAHVQIAEKFRKANHYDWFENNSKDFFFIGRHILRHRTEFSKLVIEYMSDWMTSPDTTGIDSRAKIVYGSAYAGFRAAAKIFKCDEKLEGELKLYRTWLCKKSRESVTEIQKQVNVNQFWTDLLSAVEAGMFGNTAGELKRYFKAVLKPNAITPVPIDQQADQFRNYQWKSYYLYFTPNAVIDILRKFKVQTHRDLPLEINDIFRQMQTRPYFVHPPKGRNRIRLRFKARSAQDCWCVDVDKHESGYIDIPMDELLASMATTDQNFVADTDWSDPRQGDLFTLIHKLLRKEENSSQSSFV